LVSLGGLLEALSLYHCRNLSASISEVIASVKKALKGAGIEIPYIHHTLMFKKPLSVEGKLEALQTESKAV